MNDLSRLAQDCLTACPVIVVGTGASIPYGVGGMGPLRDHVSDRLRRGPLAAEPEIEDLLALLVTQDLEQALSKLQLKEHQEREVLFAAWEKVHADDCVLYEDLARKAVEPHLVTLFRHLFDSTNRQIHVVTTNYDRMVEYCANLAGFGALNGFADGYIATRVGIDRGRSCRYGCTSSGRSRVVQVWKVHGSLDWFSDASGRVACYPALTQVLDGLSPVIVTPGIGKYARTHEEPFRTVIAEADKALGGATSFLCVGYGFNDSHIHPKLTERATVARKPVVVLARQLTRAAKDTLASLGSSPYLAIEEAEAGKSSRIFTNSLPAGEEVEVADLYDLDTFLASFILSKRS